MIDRYVCILVYLEEASWFPGRNGLRRLLPCDAPLLGFTHPTGAIRRTPSSLALSHNQPATESHGRVATIALAGILSEAEDDAQAKYRQ